MLLLSRRRTYKPHEITWDSIASEATGKQFVMPVEDKEGRQIVVMRPRWDFTPDWQINNCSLEQLIVQKICILLTISYCWREYAF